MIALDAALRRLTVCQLTHESRGNGGGLRPRVWLRLRAAAGGNWTPDGILQLEGEANFSLARPSAAARQFSNPAFGDRRQSAGHPPLRLKGSRLKCSLNEYFGLISLSSRQMRRASSTSPR